VDLSPLVDALLGEQNPPPAGPARDISDPNDALLLRAVAARPPASAPVPVHVPVPAPAPATAPLKKSKLKLSFAPGFAIGPRVYGAASQESKTPDLAPSLAPASASPSAPAPALAPAVSPGTKQPVVVSNATSENTLLGVAGAASAPSPSDPGGVAAGAPAEGGKKPAARIRCLKVTACREHDVEALCR
jgi:hypothetical protein